MIPEKETNLDEEKNKELRERLKKEIDTLDTKQARRILAEVEKEWIDTTIKTTWEMDCDFQITPCRLGDVYEILNKDNNLIRDGFITIGGEMSSGKTSFVTDLAIDLLKHDKDTCFLFFSLDDGIPLTHRRILSQLNNQNLFGGGYDAKHHKDAHRDILEKIVLRESIKIPDLESLAGFVKNRTKSKRIIIGVDYLQAIPPNPDEPATDRRFMFNDYLKALKEIQKTLQDAGGCILFCLSQLNRDNTGGALRYRESSEIENQSDVCLDLELPGGKDCPDRATNNRIIRVQKNKMGKRRSLFETSISNIGTMVFSKLEYAQDRKQESGRRNNEITERDLR